MLRLTLLSVMLCLPLALSVIRPKCYPTRADFKTACEQDFGGLMDGSRCFFIGGNGSWESGWNLCRQHGSQLAQLHTESEYYKVVEYLKARLGAAIFALVALRDQTSIPIPNGQCQVDSNYALWYDNETGPNSQLKVGNTWLKYHHCADVIPHSVPKCFVIWHRDDPTGSYPLFPYAVGDAPCLAPSYFPNYYTVLCQFNNEAVNFTKTDVCLIETPTEIETVNSAADCGRVCGNRGWCRSFNYIITGHINTCQLFPRSIHDKCPNCASSTAGNGTCVHYNYVP